LEMPAAKGPCCLRASADSLLGEEGFDVGDGLGDAVGRERLQKSLAVALAGDARIEEDKHSAVMEGTDESAKSLFQSEDGFGDLIVEERAAASFFDGFHACLDNGIAGDGEGQAVDDDATERFALDVDSLPETGGAEEDGVGSTAELFEQSFARCSAMEKDGEIEDGQEPVVENAHLAVAGEETEGAAARDFEDTLNAASSGLGELRITRIGHLRREIEEGLLAVTKVRGDDEFARFSESEAAAQMFESALHGERGRSEDDGGDLLEDELVKKLGDVDRSGLKESSARRRTQTTATS